MGRRLWAGATGRPGPACGITRDQTPAAPAPQAAANLRPKSCCACGAALATRQPPAAKRLTSVPQAAPRTSPSSRTRASSNSSGRRTLSTLCERPLHLLVDHGRSRAVSLVAPREFGLCSGVLDFGCVRERQSQCALSSTCIMCFFIAQTLHPYLTVAAKLRQSVWKVGGLSPPPKLSCLIGAFA